MKFNKYIYGNCAKTLAQVFSSEFCEISKNTFFTEHLWATTSDFEGFMVDFFNIPSSFTKIKDWL